MQIPIIPFRGQKKPYNSIPRINWAHPLAANLTTYCYDAGGVIIDLVNGGVGKVFTSTTHLTTTVSPFGTGYKYAGTATSDWVGMNGTILNNNVTAAAPYSFSCACYPVASGISGNNIAGNGVAGGGTQCLQLIGSGTSFKFNFNNGGTQLTAAAGTFSLNAFHTATAVCTASAVGALYCNGKLDQTVAATMTQSLTGQRVSFNNPNPDTAHNPGGINGFIYYWAEWKRALSAAEVANLHADPYCFLIYPEDEIFSTIGPTQATVGTTTIWITGVGTGSFRPQSSANAKIECWGCGNAQTSTQGGAGGGYAAKNSFLLTENNGVPFQLGQDATGSTGDCWFNSTSTVYAINGANFGNAQTGDVTHTGGQGGGAISGNMVLSGGGGAAGPNGNGAIGGDGQAATPNASGGGGGGANGGVTGGAGVPFVASAIAGGNGGNPGTGSGLGGTGVVGAAGNPGTLGGGGAGGGVDSGGNVFSGGAGGDDWNNGGGGGGSISFTGVLVPVGANGGTPGGGGGGCAGLNPSVGGFAMIKITYSGNDPDQIICVGDPAGFTAPGTPFTVNAQIPSNWTSASAEAWGAAASGTNGSGSGGGASGGGGAYSKLNSLTFVAGSPLAVLVDGSNNGSASSIGAQLQANSGIGTAGGVVAGGIGDVKFVGGAGRSAVAADNGPGGGGAAGAGGAGVVGVAASASTTGGNGGNAAASSGGAGGLGVATASGGNGTADMRGGGGGAGGGIGTTVNGGNGDWPGGGGGAGGKGTGANAGTGAGGAVIITGTRAVTAAIVFFGSYYQDNLEGYWIREARAHD